MQLPVSMVSISIAFCELVETETRVMLGFVNMALPCLGCGVSATKVSPGICGLA